MSLDKTSLSGAPRNGFFDFYLHKSQKTLRKVPTMNVSRKNRRSNSDDNVIVQDQHNHTESSCSNDTQNAVGVTE